MGDSSSPCLVCGDRSGCCSHDDTTGDQVRAQMTVETLRKICSHHDPKKVYRAGPSALVVVRREENLQSNCELCGSHWVSIRTDRVVDHRYHDIMADALREGRAAEAIAIFVEFNWRDILAQAKRYAGDD